MHQTQRNGHLVQPGLLCGLTWTPSVGQELFSGATGDAWAMEAIISAAETGFTGSLVGSSIPCRQRHTLANALMGKGR